MKKARTAEKAIAVLLALSLLSCLTACGGKPTAGPTIPSNSSSSDVLDPGGEADTNTSEETPTQGSGDGEVCYLPVKVMGFYDIPEEAANKLGHGSYDETIATYEYDDAGRLTGYASGSITLTFQYLDEIALPATLETQAGITISFTEPRWAQDAPEIVMDVSYDGEVLPADFRLSELQQDDDGKLVAATIFWESQLGEETYSVAGHTFDEKGNLLFVPLNAEEYQEEYKYQYGADGQVVGFEYWETYGGEFNLMSTVKVDEEGHPVSVEGVIGDNNTYTDMGDGSYRDEAPELGGNWYELSFDEAGNLARSSWYAQISGITYTYTVEYTAMPASQYLGTPVDYTNVYPLFRYKALGLAYDYAEAAGSLQLPIVSQVILALWL